MPCPYIQDHHDAVNMVWHHNEFIDCGILEMFSNRLKAFVHDLCTFVQMHCPVINFAENIFSMISADGYEIAAGPTVSVVFKP